MEETSYLLAEWLASEAVHGSIAFPEIVVPIVVQVRKSIKDSKSSQGSAKNQGTAKSLLERVEESARWVEERRRNVSFAPGKTDNVAEWERDLKTKLSDAPLFKYLKIQRKVRDKRQKLADKVCYTNDNALSLIFINQQAREGEDAIVEDDEEME